MLQDPRGSAATLPRPRGSTHAWSRGWWRDLLLLLLLLLLCSVAAPGAAEPRRAGGPS